MQKLAEKVIFKTHSGIMHNDIGQEYPIQFYLML